MSVEFYGGAYSAGLKGQRRRVYIKRLDYVSFTSEEEEARLAFLKLWRQVERPPTMRLEGMRSKRSEV